MNRYELELLKYAYENYIKTKSKRYTHHFTSTRNLEAYTGALMYLIEAEHILPLSENITPLLKNPGALSFVSTKGITIQYEITDFGIRTYHNRKDTP